MQTVNYLLENYGLKIIPPVLICTVAAYGVFLLMEMYLKRLDRLQRARRFAEDMAGHQAIKKLAQSSKFKVTPCKKVFLIIGRQALFIEKL